MEILQYLDVWDFLAIFMLLFALWLVLSGTKKLKAIAPDMVNAKTLNARAYGAIAVALTYLLVHLYMIKENM